MEDLGDIKGENAVENENSVQRNEWLDILGSGGINKKILTKGVENVRPKRGDEVIINAVGYLEDKTQVEEFKELMFTLGGSEVVPGFDIVVALMDLSEEAEIFMESRFAYGAVGLEPSIPPEKNLVYIVKLLEVKAEKLPDEMVIEERKMIGERKRDRGNFWFNRDEYNQAMQCYKSAVDFLDDTSDPYSEHTSEQVKEIIEMRLKTLNNMAATQLKLGAYKAALISLEPVIKCQPNNVKALYRKGKILSSQQKFNEALDTFRVALSFEPQSRLIQAEFNKLLEIRWKEAEDEKSLYRKMFTFTNSSIKKEERYPTLRGKHLKTLAIAFIILLIAGITINMFVNV